MYGYVNKQDILGKYDPAPKGLRFEDLDHEKDIDDAFEASNSLKWYRVNQDLKADDKPVDVLKRVKPHCFFPPQYIALRGIVYSVIGQHRVLAW